ncbi:MAG: cytochrome c biogenesis protein ResB, partial [Cyclobacteriaceae bacterium]|nr:cytochrome c biogenesis protein ResB [Cyclobacteriaceae bacterium]
MAVATFIENDYGTLVARNLVYESLWFEGILLWMAINFIFHIGKYKLFSKQKLALGLFHIAFVVIIIGAGITRYFSNEGVIHIRERQTQSTYFTAENYLQLANEQDQTALVKQAFIPTVFKPDSFLLSIDNKEFSLHVEAYIKGARQGYGPGEQTIFEITVLDNGVRKDYKLNAGEVIEAGKTIISTSLQTDGAIQVFQSDSLWMIRSSHSMQIMQMTNQQISSLDSGIVAPLKLRSLYQWGSGSLVVRNIYKNVKPILESEPNEKLAKDLLDGIQISVHSHTGEKIKTGYFLKVNRDPSWIAFEHEGQNYRFTYGPKAEHLPFALHLKDFQLERYPGSTSPSSYASEVIVNDQGKEYPFRIFMNNVLDYGGYRFYQSSYDSDEKGTVLAINQDRPGTFITYFGYLLLAFGMMWTLFAPASRFQQILRKLGKLDKAPAIVALALFPLFTYAQQTNAHAWLVPQDWASDYGRLIVQDLDGRMKPINTLANEITRKIHGKSQIEVQLNTENVKLSAEQFLLAVQLEPEQWSKLPIIKIDQLKAGDMFDLLDMPPSNYLSFQDLTTQAGEYKILSFVEEANRLTPSQRSEWHNEILKVDERFNIFYGLIIGDFLRIFPNRFDTTNTWFTATQYGQGFDPEDANFVKNITGMYLEGLRKGIATGAWDDAEQVYGYINLYQKKAGIAVYPAQKRIEAEIFYTRINLGNRLFGFFWFLGIILLAVAIILLFHVNTPLTITWKIGNGLALIGWIAFTGHLGLRWYIAEHPPWSDGFEMLVFVAWGILLFGLIFSRKSRFTVPLALLFSGTLLFVSFLDWLNPEITNLMPVLNSYWLKIHVAIIVSSYAPLALSAILGLMSLLFLIFKPKNPQNNWWDAQKELIA